MPDDLPTLGELLDHLSRELSALPTEPAHLIPDLVISHLALDAAEQADVVQRHTNPNTNRALWVNARAAFEASIELLYILSVPAEYDLRACSARCFELLEAQVLQRQFLAADLDGRGTSDLVLEHAEDPILADADAWDRIAPGRGRIMRQAFEVVQERIARREKHWSGLSASAINRHIERDLPLDRGTAAILCAFTGTASAQAHPRSRSLHRVPLQDPESGVLTLALGRDDTENIHILTRLALVFVAKGVEARRAIT